MMPANNSTEGTKNDQWQNIGFVSKENNGIIINDCSTGSDAKSSKTDPRNDVKDGKYKKQLPLSIKNILSPNARIKSDRKANYMYRHSHDKVDTNLLILIHGAGDSHLPYHALAKKMEMPQTATLSINANAMGEGFVTLPFGLGYTWFEEMDYNTGQVLNLDNARRVVSLNNASDKLDQLIDRIMKEDEMWLPERVFLLGFSAGACVVMNVCYNRAQQGKRGLGGAICVAGGLKGRTMNDQSSIVVSPEFTPLLLMGGENDETYPSTMLQLDAKLYNTNHKQDLVRTFIQARKEHGMIKEKEEIKCIMEFFADKMVRRMIAMEGFSEVSSFPG